MVSKNFIKTHIFPWRVALLSPIKRSKCQLSNSFFTHTWVYYVQQQHRVDRLSWAAAVIYYATQKPRLISNEMVLVVSIPNQTVLYISPSNSVGGERDMPITLTLDSHTHPKSNFNNFHKFDLLRYYRNVLFEKNLHTLMTFFFIFSYYYKWHIPCEHIRIVSSRKCFF